MTPSQAKQLEELLTEFESIETPEDMKDLQEEWHEKDSSKNATFDENIYLYGDGFFKGFYDVEDLIEFLEARND